MDLGFNKIAFCVLGTGLLIIGLQQGSAAFFHEPHHEKAGYHVDVPDVVPGGPAVVVPTGPRDYGTLLAAADVEAGKEFAVRCKQCHSLEPGGPVVTGPPLYGVIGTKIASHAPSFKYSAALSSKEGNWDFEHLDHFLENPNKYAPGTAMSYQGAKKAADRANLMAYLNTLTTAPIPVPAPLPPQATPDPAATPTDGATPADPGASPTPGATTAPGATPSPAASGTPAAPATPTATGAPAAPKPTPSAAPAPH